ncbi:MAG: polymer-forming cytoskeletal protein [Candidatus Berkelbacteria bacterium]
MMGDKNVSGPSTIIGANVKLVGTLYDANEITVHGQIEGEIKSDNNIIITETAYVKGPISAETVQIAGQVFGSITAMSKLEILPTGKVYGSTTTKDLNIRSGAIFIGKSNMPNGEKEMVAAEEMLDDKEIAS